MDKNRISTSVMFRGFFYLTVNQNLRLMKKLLLAVAVLALFTSTSFGVAIEKVSQNSVEFFNFSGGTYDLTGHMVSVNDTWYNVDNLTLASGDLNVGAQTRVVLEGIVAPDMAASVGLWFPGTNSMNASEQNIVDFVQYGSTGQDFEVTAIAAALWAADLAAPGPLPIERTDAANGTGNGTWQSNAVVSINSFDLDKSITIAPNPIQGTMNFTIGDNALSQIESFSYQLIDISGKVITKATALRSKEVSVDAADLPVGVYILNITTKNGAVLNRRIMKN